MFRRSATARPKRFGLSRDHDPGGDVIVQSEHGDGRLADREGRRRYDGRQQALEPFARFGQLGRDAGFAGMDLGADMVSDQAHDPFAVGGRHALARISKPS
jgi:hypothetical protein